MGPGIIVLQEKVVFFGMTLEIRAFSLVSIAMQQSEFRVCLGCRRSRRADSCAGLSEM
jgi:hypothetical protein